MPLMPKASGSAITAGRKGSDLEASSFTKGLSSFSGMLGSAIASISAFTDMGRADVFTDLRGLPVSAQICDVVSLQIWGVPLGELQPST